MSMSKSEILYVKICLIVVGGMALYLGGFNYLWPRWTEVRDQRDTAKQDYEQSLNRDKTVKDLETLERKVAMLQEKLNVKVPGTEREDQISKFTKELEDACKKHEAKIGTLIQRVEKTIRRRTSKSAPKAETISFRFNFQTSQTGLIAILKSIRDMGPPSVISNLGINIDPKDPNKLAIEMELYTYIFTGKKT